MSRPGAKDLRDDEREAIRQMFLAGVLIAEILRTTGRSETTVWRVVRDLDRKRPTTPPGRHSRRDDKIMALAEKGWSRAKLCKHFRLKPSRLAVIISQHPRIRELLRNGVRPAEIARRFRMETSTVLRIMGKKIDRTRDQVWLD
jgi:DNA invertase Pin-like site-specific DNA recombinase